ncbi:DsbA family oxidoreductase [Nocardiopsis terrae]
MTTVTVWADVRCPWCWMGHRQLAAAVRRLGADRGVTVVRRSYLLEPTGPDGPALTVREAALTSWGMDRAGWEAMRERVAAAARRDGLAIDMDGVRNVDSRPVHRLLKMAEARGADPDRAWDLAFSALLERHEDVADPAVLRRLGAAFGLDPAEVDGLSDSDGFAEQVGADHRAAVEHGVRSVPAFLHGDRVLSGRRDAGELAAFLSGEGVVR